MDQAVVELLADGQLREVDDQPLVCNPLSMDESSTGKKRLILNRRHVNRLLHKQGFEHEDLRKAMLSFERSDCTVCSL